MTKSLVRSKLNRSFVAFALTLFIVTFAGCGGENGDSGNEGGGSEGGDKTFEGDGYSFTYPGEWEEGTSEAAGEVGEITSTVTLGPGKGANALAVGTGRTSISVTEENIEELSDDAAAGMEQVFQQAQGQLTKGPYRTTVGGLPALRFEGSSVNKLGDRTQSEVVLAFDERTQYFFNCQYTPEHAEEMKRGCDQVEESFQVE